MKVIEGVNITDLISFPFNNMKVIADLKYYDGPIITHFISNEHQYLSCWVDDDESAYRWLIFEVEERNLLDYLMNKLSLKDLFDNSLGEFIFLADVANEEYIQTKMLPKSILEKDYMPEESDYFRLPFPEKYNVLKEKYFKSPQIERFKYAQEYTQQKIFLYSRNATMNIFFGKPIRPQA